MTKNKVAVITGVTGQDGGYLSKLLLEKGYKVVGIARRSSVKTTERLSLLKILDHSNFELAEGDVSDAHSINSIITKHQPDEVYNLAAQSHVHTSFEQPGYTWGVNANGCLFMLEAIRNYCPTARFYQASTSEMFGVNHSSRRFDDISHTYYQDEATAFAPTSPYAVSKLAAHHTVQTYRRAYGLHASCGILFNHESELRGEAFVTRKITQWVASLVDEVATTNGYCEPLTQVDDLTFSEDMKIHLGNIEACRDWGHAEDYVRAMWLMLQQETPDDYVIATGETRSVLDFVCAAFRAVGWNDDPAVVRSYIYIDAKFYRPSEVEFLLGDPGKAKARLGWESEISFSQ